MEMYRSSRPASESGQYLVEFSLSFVVFMIFVFFVIDMGLMIYNHNVFYHGVYLGAREAALGAENETIKNTVVQEVVPKYFPTLFMRAYPDTGVQVLPKNEIERVEGSSVTVRMDATFGLTLMGLYTMTMEVPFSSQELIVANNDEDRDGCKDALEGGTSACSGYLSFAATFPRDHDNDGFQDNYNFGGSDQDADNDGIAIEDETITVAYFKNPPTGSPTFAIDRDTGLVGSTFTVGGTQWEEWFDGHYHAPVHWADDTQTNPQYFPRKVPKWHVDNSGDTVYKRDLFTEYDADNDGWEDKYDRFPRDPQRH